MKIEQKTKSREEMRGRKKSPGEISECNEITVYNLINGSKVI